MFTKEGQDIRNEILKERSLFFGIRLLIGIIIIAVVIFIAIVKIKCSNGLFLMKFYETLVASTTILAAAVIFFYSVQNHTKGGIPNRTILAYSVGSYTMPVLFMLSVLMLPIIYIMKEIKMKYILDVCIIFAYILHFFILGLILLSNSYAFSKLTICNAEIAQFKKRCLVDKQNINGIEVKDVTSYAWSYSMYHFEQVVLSDELIEEKISLIRMLLATPFYKKKYKKFKYTGQISKYGKHLSFLEQDHLERLYEYYYGNLSGAMKYLATDENNELRNKVYIVIYEFISDLSILYQISNKTNEKKKNYLMVVTSIMNAVLGYQIADGRDFCCYVLNHCIVEELRHIQIGLYFLLQEYLFRTSINGISTQYITCLDQIDEIEKWDFRYEDEFFYWEFWTIWMGWTTISRYSYERYFYDAIKTLKGEKISSSCLLYIRLKIKEIGERVR